MSSRTNAAGAQIPESTHIHAGRPKKAHYVLGLKDNQPTLAAAAEGLFQNVELLDGYYTYNKGHGRIEHRYYSVVKIPRSLRRSLGFPHAKTIVAVYRERCDLQNRPSGKPDVSYYLSDLDGELASPQALAYYIRGHWGIENRTHYVRSQGVAPAVAPCGADTTRMVFSC